MKYLTIALILFGLIMFAPSAFAQYMGQSTEEIGVTLGPAKRIDEKIIPPPLKQMDLGIKLGHVICDKDKNIVWNIHFKPACVYPESENTLMKRGWAKLRLMMPASADPIRELDLTGQNEFTLRILGNLIVEDDKHPFSYEKKRALVWEHSQRYYPDQKYLEYAIEPHKQYYAVGNTIPLTLLEWGNYSECWNLVVSIVDKNNNIVYEDNSVRYCAEPDGVPGTFHSYTTGEELKEFVCPKPDYYRVMVSNGDVFEKDVLSNFVCVGASENSKGLCQNFGGNWISQYDECEMISSEQCSEMNGVYDSCASACRNHPDYPDVICTKQCVPVCSR